MKTQIQSTKKQICTIPNLGWIGYTSCLRPLKLELESNLKLIIDNFGSAREGVEATTQKPYQVIIVNDVLSAGGLALARYVSSSDGYAVAAEAIRQIRQTKENKTTPIIVTHLGYFMNRAPREALEMYKQAGATECFDWTKRYSGDFSNLVAKYLKPKQYQVQQIALGAK